MVKRMNTLHTKGLKSASQELRNNMTLEEKHLWYDYLKPLPVVVKRQKVIGKYIADFYVPSHKIVIDLDGSQHYSDEGIEYDLERNEYMESLGITVLRYSNLDINHRFDSVCEDIGNHLNLYC